VCAGDWPCEAARAALLDAYGGHGRRDLMSFLGVQLLLAEEDLCATLGGERPSAYAMFRRFLTWARRPPVPAAGSHGAEAG